MCVCVNENALANSDGAAALVLVSGEKALRVGNVVVPSGFVGNQWMEGKVGW